MLFLKLLLSDPATGAAAAPRVGEIFFPAGKTAREWVAETFPLGLLNTLILAAIAGVVAFVLIRLIKFFFERKAGGNVRIIYRLIYILILLIAAMVVVSNITPLAKLGTWLMAGSGIAAVVIGLAAQQTLGNLLSGISISANKPFLVGEIVEILDTNPPISGVVKDIGLRHTVIADITNKRIVIPNSMLDTKIIRTSHTLDKEKNIVNLLSVYISYASDIDLAIDILRRLCEEHEDSIDVRTEKEIQDGAPKVNVFVMEMGSSSITLRASIWTKDPITGFRTLSDLRYAVKKEYEKQGIEAPHPYQNVVVTRKKEE